MKNKSRPVNPRTPIMLAALALLCTPAATRAQRPVTFEFGGHVTAVEDPLNWFQDTYSVGAPVSGTYTFFDSGYARSSDPTDPGLVLYEFPAGLNPDLRVVAGGRTVRTGPTTIALPFQFIVADNYAGPFDDPGDTYRVGSPVAFPDFFRNWAGDPVADPDGNFSPYTLATLSLQDPTGGALSSLDLPLTPPAASAFPVRVGRVIIGDGSTFEDHAVVTFAIDSLTAVPEPAALAPLALASLAALCRRPR
jgi:hypothetical protein